MDICIVSPISDPRVVSLFARGESEFSREKTERLSELVQKSMEVLIERQFPWCRINDYLDRYFRKKNLGVRLYPAGRAPFIKYPVAVMFSRRGTFHQVFHIQGLPNEAPEFILPVESNMSPDNFNQLLSNIIQRGKKMGSGMLPYEVLARIQKIPGVSNWGVTVRKADDLTDKTILVVAENPFGSELRVALEPTFSSDCNLELRMGAKSADSKESEEHIGFLLYSLMEMVKSWPCDSPAGEMLKKMNIMMKLLYDRGVTRSLWKIKNKQEGKENPPVFWTIDLSDKKRTATVFFRVETGNKHAWIDMICSGFSESSVKSVDNFLGKPCMVNHRENGLIKKLKSSLKKNSRQACEPPDSGKKESTQPKVYAAIIPDTLADALIHVTAGCLDTSIGELRSRYQHEMKKFGLGKEIRIDHISLFIENGSLFLHLPLKDGSFYYKFQVERRSESKGNEAELIQMDNDGNVLDRLSVTLSDQPEPEMKPIPTGKAVVADDSSFLKTRL